MWRANTASWRENRPEGKIFRFHVRPNSVEPPPSSRICNLFSHDDIRASCADEAVELGPKVSLVGNAFSEAGTGKRLAWAGAGPKWTGIRPAGNPGGKRPSSDACEEVALRVTIEIGRFNVENRSVIYIPRRNQVLRD